MESYYVLVTETKKTLYKTCGNNPQDAMRTFKKFKNISAPERTFIEVIGTDKKYEIKDLILK